VDSHTTWEDKVFCHLALIENLARFARRPARSVGEADEVGERVEHLSVLAGGRGDVEAARATTAFDVPSPERSE
jgi:hypothetical protein